MAKNAIRLCTMAEGMALPLIFTGRTARGCIMRTNSLRTTLRIISARELLKPPVVDPEQAPTNISKARIIQVI